MPLKSIDFSKEISPGADPLSPNAGLLVSASETEAKGKAVKQGNDMALATEATKMGIDAARGYVESGMEKDIKSTIGKLDTANKFGDAVMAANALDQDPSATPADLKSAQEQIQKYKTALDQGVMTREQALLAIDKSVKEYSNMLPGYASNLRRLATTVTGVEHMGNYAEYALLTKQTQSEKMREQALKDKMALDQKMMADYVDKYKKLPAGGLNGPDMAMFRQEAAVIAKAEQLKAQTQIKDATVAQTEPVVTNYIQTRLAGGVLTLSQRLTGIVSAVDPKTGRPQSPENRILLRQQILSDITTTFEGIKADLASFNANQVSNSTRETLMTRLNTQQTQLTDALKNQDTFDDFKKTMSIQSDMAKNVWDKFVIANPHATIMKNSGMVTPDTVKLWIDSQRDPRRQAEFRKTYGNNLDDYYRSFSSGLAGTAYSDNATRMGTDPTHLGKIKDTDPGQYSAQLHTLRDSIQTVAQQGWGETPETQQVRKNQFGNWIQSFANQVDPSKPDMVREWSRMVADPAVAARIKELDPQAQLNAIGPIFVKTRELLEDPQFGMFKRLAQLQEKSKHGLVGSSAGSFEVILNPITKQFEIATLKKRSATPNEMTPAGASGFPTYRPGGYVISGGGAAQSGEVKMLLDTINRGLASINNFKEIPGLLPEDMKTNGVNGEYFNLFINGFFSATDPEEQAAALKKTGTISSAELIGGQSTPGTRKVLDIKGIDDELRRVANELKTPNLSAKRKLGLERQREILEKEKQEVTASAGSEE